MPSERFQRDCGLLGPWIVGLLVGCSALTPGQAPPLPINRCAEIQANVFQIDSLSCSEGDCDRCYALELERAQQLRVNLFVASGHPPFRVAIRDDEGSEVDAGDTRRNRPQTLLRSNLDAGRYEIRVEALSLDDPTFTFELVAKLSDLSGPIQRARVRAEPRVVSDPRREIPRVEVAQPEPQAEVRDDPFAVPDTRQGDVYSPEPEPQETIPVVQPEPVPEPVIQAPELPREPLPVEKSGREAFIVDVEANPAGGPARLLIGLGSAQGVRAGATGEILLDGRSVGRIEVSESLTSGSWAVLTSPTDFSAEEILDRGVVRIDAAP